MRKIDRKTCNVLITSEILCNKCGGSCEVKTNEFIDYPIFSGLLEVEAIGGYFSELLGDMEAQRFSLCEKCLMELINSFKIPPEKFERHILHGYRVDDDGNAKLSEPFTFNFAKINL
jgi:hypothetical protein